MICERLWLWCACGTLIACCLWPWDCALAAIAAGPQGLQGATASGRAWWCSELQLRACVLEGVLQQCMLLAMQRIRCTPGCTAGVRGFRKPLDPGAVQALQATSACKCLTHYAIWTLDANTLPHCTPGHPI
jgi:hypothetical protein